MVSVSFECAKGSIMESAITHLYFDDTTFLCKLTGPEVTAEAVKVLQTVASKAAGVEFNIQNHDFGGIAIDNHGNPLPDSTLEACRKSDAILLGAQPPIWQ